jgi:hypothetical protein
MKILVEIALVGNGLIALGVGYCYLFHRTTYWPAVKNVIEAVLEI